MKDIFAGFSRMCRDIAENTPLKSGSYESVKQIVTACVGAFEMKYGSIHGVTLVEYHLEEIEELYSLIDSGLQDIDIEIRALVEKHLFQNLISHVEKLKCIYEEDNREIQSL